MRFKLHAPRGTVVQGTYDGLGHLRNFSVSPASRRKDVVFAACVNASDVQWQRQ